MKKIFLTRHGEAMDDIENRYGGWYDAELSPDGIKGAKKTAERFKGITAKPRIILSSPFRRAMQTAEIIGKELDIKIERFVYLKERNTYGLLCGENQDEAKEKYPELVEMYEKGQTTLGAEDYNSFLERVKVLVNRLKAREEDILICVSHGKLLKALFGDILGIETGKFADNCIVEVDMDDNGELKLTNSNGVEIKR